MSSPYITITPDDPDFHNYLLGDFSKTLRALPIESFRQHSERARITFQLVPIDTIKKPAWWRIYLSACRPDLLGMTLGPFVITGFLVARELNQAPSFPISYLLAGLGLFFLHVASFLFNDFYDHMRGVDLANRRRGSQVIQRGWASAREVRGWAYVNLALALLFGGPSVCIHWPQLGPVAILAALIGVGLSFLSSVFARYGLTDLLVFIGLGPLLTMASSVAGFGTVRPEAFFLGTAFGSLAVLTLQIRQLENLFRAGRDSFRTFIGAFDFDRAKMLVLAQALFVAALQIAMATQIFHRWVAVVGFVFAIVPMALLALQIRRAASPLSSDLIHLGQRAVWIQTALLAWWGAAIWI